MGQALSKSIASRLQRASRKNEANMIKEAVEEAERKKAEAAAGKYGGFTDPSASLGGFRRDRGKIWEVERQQEDFLRQQKGGSEKDAEMNADLLKFLNEAGPVERRVDKELTSPKVYEALKDEETERRLREQASSMRQRRRMPLAERLEDPDAQTRDEEERMAFSVNRTTNFSTWAEEEDPTVVRLRDVDLLGLLRKGPSSSVMPSVASAQGSGGLPSAEEAAEAYLRDVESTFPKGVVAAATVREDNLFLLTNALKYGGVPTLMKEIESAEYIGVWEDKVNDLKKLQLRLVGDGEIALGLDETKRKEQEEEGAVEAAGAALKASAMFETERKDERMDGPTEAVGASLGEEEAVAGKLESSAGTETVKAPKPGEEQNTTVQQKGSSATGTAAFLEEERRRHQEQAEGHR